MREINLWSGMKLHVFIIFLVFFINSCGGGGGSNSVAGGGIGGTGLYAGVITGFGSVFVNGDELDTTGAVITVNGNNATEDELRVGMKIEVEAEAGRALTIDFQPEIRGEVESVDTANGTLVVLGQTVITDSTTVFDGITGIADLNPQDNVVVSGFFNTSNDIRATYIALDTTPLQEYEVKGVVSNLDTNNKTFNINSLPVDYSNVSNPPPFTDGSFVEVKGVLQGQVLVASSIELESILPSGNPDDEMKIEGIITSVSSQSDFEVNGLRVLTVPATLFENGTQSDIAIDARVEVEGVVDSSGALVADKVEFRFFDEKDVKIEGTVESVDTLNSTIRIFGIDIMVDATTQMDDKSSQQLRPFTLSDIHAGDFLEVGGFVNNLDEIVAVKVEREDYPGQGNDLLKGPVDSIDKVAETFVIRGVTIDASDPSVEFEDENGGPIDASYFFDNVGQGDIVEAVGSYSSGVLTATKVEIERRLVP